MNRLYTSAKDLILNGELLWLKDDIRAWLVSNRYAPDFKNHKDVRDVPMEAIVAESARLEGKRIKNGAVFADPTTFKAVVGEMAHYIILIKVKPFEYDRLIFCIDTVKKKKRSRLIDRFDRIVALPVVPDGGDIMIGWNKGKNGIMKL